MPPVRAEPPGKQGSPQSGNLRELQPSSHSAEASAGQRAPLVILGLDAGDPDSLLRWARAGYLPTIASVVERGCWGWTAGPEMLCQQGVWVSLASGVSAARHGYYHFRQLQPGSYDLKTTGPLDAKASPFWVELQGSGRRAAIVDVPDAGLVPGLSGFQLLDLCTHSPLQSPTSEPPGLIRRVKQLLGSSTRIQEKLHATEEEDRDIYDQLLERVRAKGELCRELLLHDGGFDLIFVVFSETHTAGHQFWRHRSEARTPDALESILANAIREVYRAIDREMGLLLRQLPPNANVALVSSTGLEDGYPNAGITDSFCRELGYQPSLGSHALDPVELLRMDAPSGWQRLLGRRPNVEKQDRQRSRKFRARTDWAKTTAFAVPSCDTGFLRVNLQGREPEGTVPEAEYDELLDRLEKDLRLLIDPVTDEPAVRGIARTRNIFGGGVPAHLPDLFVIWEPAHHLRRLVGHPSAILTQPRHDFYHGCRHALRGFFAAAGPDIHARGSLGEISLLDLAPTFLWLLGVPAPASMTGRPLNRVLTARRSA